MIIDSSVIVAVLHGEPDADHWMTRLRSEFGRLRMSAATYVEAAAVLDRARSPVVSRKFDLFLETFGIEICPVTPEQAQIAREAYRDFGRGSGHRANLNFGDCFSYALAKDRREGLMFKGDDFNHTDLGPG
ncbi:MAG: type II toxin-antitoxin system VapC family toxin [Fimbriimonadaceae bacterium]|nr:type II toxin-antitoxin system VapC family toxin [Fimbriimonadaceae bacterium]